MSRGILGAMAVVLASATDSGAAGGGGRETVLMASTIGPIDAGIVQRLEDEFEKDTGIRVRHVGAGTGQALEIAESGSVDLVLVHARSLEEKFVADGYGTRRIPFMYNDFVIVGPAGDPAGIKAAKGATDALRAIAAKQAPFVSRGDNSGTHVAEKELWRKAGVEPGGAWYLVYDKGAEGNKATLRHAADKQAYTVMDRATWISSREGLSLALLYENDPALLNHITLIPVSKKRFPRVNERGAAAFVKWLTSMKGQSLVAEFGKAEVGEPLFFPESDEWRRRTVK